MKILIMIPAYNEELNIERVVNNLTDNFPQYDYVVINDGSKDDTGTDQNHHDSSRHKLCCIHQNLRQDTDDAANHKSKNIIHIKISSLIRL